MLKIDIHEGEAGVNYWTKAVMSPKTRRQNEVPSPIFATAVRIEPVPGAKWRGKELRGDYSNSLYGRAVNTLLRISAICTETTQYFATQRMAMQRRVEQSVHPSY
jgi:hypothetical protein